MRDTLEECSSAERESWFVLVTVSLQHHYTKWSAGAAEPELLVKQNRNSQHFMTIHQGAMPFVEQQENFRVVIIGGSKSGTKIAKLDRMFHCPPKLSKTNWLGAELYGGTFLIEADEDIIIVVRKDSPGKAWGMNLKSNAALHRTPSSVKIQAKNQVPKAGSPRSIVNLIEQILECEVMVGRCFIE